MLLCSPQGKHCSVFTWHFPVAVMNPQRGWCCWGPAATWAGLALLGWLSWQGQSILPWVVTVLAGGGLLNRGSLGALGLQVGDPMDL